MYIALRLFLNESLLICLRTAISGNVTRIGNAFQFQDYIHKHFRTIIIIHVLQVLPENYRIVI